MMHLFLWLYLLLLLSFGSIFIGYTSKEMMIGLGSNFWSNALFILPKNNVLLESEYIPQTIKLLPLIFTFFRFFFLLFYLIMKKFI